MPAGGTKGIEPIAVVGMACRVPGARNAEEFWRLLCNGEDVIREVPGERFDIDAVYSARSGTPGRTTVRWGGFLEKVEEFDAGFFGISPHEASLMDPAQRHLLEVSWEAIEDVGWTSQELAGSDTSVFVGHNSSAYWELLTSNLERLDMYAANGSAAGVLSGRLSYAFDLRGPSLTVDTACSASLMAVHLACRSLRTGECSRALVGGAHLVLSASETVAYSQSGMLSSDGWCKFGDESADGFVRSDGVGVVALKPLRTALADGDRVRAVIRGSAVTNDGRSSGLMAAPSAEGQARAIAAACAEAGVDPAHLDYVEAHGTGTPVGDPIELEALARVVGPGRPAGSPCLVGSVKTNIGHPEGAAGIVGLVKTVLCLEHRAIPPSLHLRAPAVAAIREGGPLQIPTSLVALPSGRHRMLAGMNSTGISGTNIHVVLGEADPVPSPAGAGAEPRESLLTVSARTPRALRASARSHLRLMQEGSGHPGEWQNMCFSAATRRTHHEWRLVLQAAGAEEAVGQLRAFLAGTSAAGVRVSASPVPAQPWRIAFVFSGQGSQWPGMGLGLYNSEPVFRNRLGECDKAIDDETGWSLLDVLRSEPDRLDEPDVVQPALWAIQVSLAALWQSWGVVPDVLIGHSMGEVAAAHTAGALTLPDAAAVICRRSRIAKRLVGRGMMASVELSAARTEEFLRGYEGQVAVAARNSPHSTVISGETAAVEEVLRKLEDSRVHARRVRVDFASHCPQVDVLREELRDALIHLTPRPGEVAVHSTVLDEVIDGGTMNTDYWMRNFRQPVQLAPALVSQLQAGPTVFIEVSAHPVLTSAIQEVIDEHDLPGKTLPSLHREAGHERSTLLSTLAHLYTSGHAVDWSAFHGDEARYVPLPSYPWQHKPYWFDITPAAPQTPAEQGDGRGPASSAVQNSEVSGPDAHGAVLERLRQIAAKVLGAEPDEVDENSSLPGQGLDSLMAARLRRQCHDQLAAEVEVPVMLAGASLHDLADVVLRQRHETN